MAGFSPSEIFRVGRKAMRLLPNWKYRRGLFRGVGASIEHERELRSLGVRTIVDIGANRGQFSLLAWSLFPNARIYAFEPQSGAADYIERIFPSTAPMQLFRAAVGARSGQARMHVSRRDDNSSLLPISATMTKLYPGTEVVAVINVEIGPLNSFLRFDQVVDPALLKIDVQGGELDVLSGCDGLLDRFKYVYVELSFIELYTGQALCNDVILHLDNRGFRLIGVNEVKKDASGRTIQADFLFSKRDGKD